METFLALLPYIFGTASVASIILFFVFYRQNKTLKNHEVAKSRTEVEGGEIQNDMAQIDLGNHYLKSIIEASEMINEANKSIVSYSKDRKDGFDKLNKDIKEIKEDVKSVKREQQYIVTFLNGDYARFKDDIKKIDNDD